MEFKITIESFDEAKARIKTEQKMRATEINSRSEIGQPIFFDIILDISGSMDDFYDELVECFNDIMIPALKEAGLRSRGPMRLGCLLFSEKLIPAWWGYKTLEELGSKPLKKAMLNQNGLQGMTALYGAMRSGVLWTAAAMEYMRSNGDGESPKGKVIVLSDGADNKEKNGEITVMNALKSIGSKNAKNLQSVIGFFNTDDGLTRSQFDDMVKKTGFNGLDFYDIAKGVSVEERRKSFRHYFKIFSSQAAIL